MSPAFIDTNALVYADQVHSAFHLQARAVLARLEQDGAKLWISRQVLREYLATVTRPGPAGVPAMTRAMAATAVEGFIGAYQIAEEGPQTTARLLDLVRTIPMGGKQVHDANIAATMLVHGIRRLLTFNVADFQGSFTQRYVKRQGTAEGFPVYDRSPLIRLRG